MKKLTGIASLLLLAACGGSNEAKHTYEEYEKNPELRAKVLASPECQKKYPVGQNSPRDCDYAKSVQRKEDLAAERAKSPESKGVRTEFYRAPNRTE